VTSPKRAYIGTAARLRLSASLPRVGAGPLLPRVFIGGAEIRGASSTAAGCRFGQDIPMRLTCGPCRIR
jgi:hypothetical protein